MCGEWSYRLGEELAELHPPLVERVDAPDRTLHTHRGTAESDNGEGGCFKEPATEKSGCSPTVSIQEARAAWPELVVNLCLRGV